MEDNNWLLNSKRLSTRSQVSIFIILALMVIGLILIFTLFQLRVLDISSGINNIPGDIKPINAFIENCVEKSSKEAVYYIGDSGGYTNLPNLSTENKVAYYFYDKNNYMPSKERVEYELSDYMNNAMLFCTKNLVDFPEFEVKNAEINSTAEILDDKVIFKVKYPVSVSRGDVSYKFNSFETQVNVRLGIIYDSIAKIMEDQMKYDDICIDCMSNVAIENNLYINMMDYSDSVIFGVYDLESELNSEEYVFYFANKYPKKAPLW